MNSEQNMQLKLNQLELNQHPKKLRLLRGSNLVRNTAAVAPH